MVSCPWVYRKTVFMAKTIVSSFSKLVPTIYLWYSSQVSCFSRSWRKSFGVVVLRAFQQPPSQRCWSLCDPRVTLPMASALPVFPWDLWDLSWSPQWLWITGFLNKGFPRLGDKAWAYWKAGLVDKCENFGVRSGVLTPSVNVWEPQFLSVS